MDKRTKERLLRTFLAFLRSLVAVGESCRSKRIPVPRRSNRETIVVETNGPF